MLGASADGAYAYFVANGVLAPGAAPGNCDNSDSLFTGACSLYLFHDGATTFVARLGANGAAAVNSDSGTGRATVGKPPASRPTAPCSSPRPAAHRLRQHRAAL